MSIYKESGIIMAFVLDPNLSKENIYITEYKLSIVLLKNDKNFPWLILVPKRNSIKELYELSHEDQLILLDEINRCSRVMQQLFTPDKINIAALGNIVAQLHIHIIARYKTDAAWPNAVWGAIPAKPYPDAELSALKNELINLLK